MVGHKNHLVWRGEKKDADQGASGAVAEAGGLAAEQAGKNLLEV